MRSEITLEDHAFRVVVNHLSSHIYTLKIRENDYNVLTRIVIKLSTL